MTTSWRLCSWKLGLASLSAIAGAISCFENCAFAQIIPDATLGAQSSIVTPTVIKGTPGEEIDGGVISGANLFHSFEEFNVKAGRGAYFLVRDANIRNVLARMTGGSRSEILGTLGTLSVPGINSNPNLFLINPHGIIFGPNARLDVRGSFVATTANAIQFGNQGFFSAAAPEVPTLLTVNPSAFFFNQIAGSITSRAAGLQVDPGKNLLLLGGDVRLESGRLIAVGGRVELGGVAGAGTVGLNVEGDRSLSLSFPTGVARADVSLTNNSEVNVIGEGGGSIALNARNVDVLQGSSIRAGIRPLGGSDNAQAGDISLYATDTTSVDNGFIYNAVFGKGSGGNLSINTGQLIVRDGVVATATIGEGRAGDLTVNASHAVELTGTLAGGTVPIDLPIVGLRSGQRPIKVPIGLFAASLAIGDFIDSTYQLPSGIPRSGGGNAGNLTIETGKLIAEGGATVSASTTSRGQGGSLTVNARESIKLSGTSRPAESGSVDGSGFGLNGVIPSGMRNETRGRGSAGDLKISTGQLVIEKGAWVTTGTAGEEAGGNLTVNARDFVEVSGTSERGFPSVLAAGNQGNGRGAAKNVTIDTRRLTVQDGAVITAGTTSKGSGGNLLIRALDSVELIGTGTVKLSASDVDTLIGVSLLGIAADNAVPSGLITGTAGEGNAGNLTIETERLVIQGGAQASVSTVGKGNAGNLTVRASSVKLTGISADVQSPNAIIGRSLLTTAADQEATGRVGDLTIETRQLIVQDGAAVVVSNLSPANDALGAGNLEIQAQTIRLDNQGEITAETASGNGGNIKLEVQDLLLMSNESRISADASGTANGGNINIDTNFLIASPPQGPNGSDIVANAIEGNGGRLDIAAASIFGIEYRPILTPLNDITARSEFGDPGVVTLNTPDVDPSQGLVNLPAELVDVSGLIAQTCPASGRQGQSEFIVTGRGGLPPNSSEALSSEPVQANWVTLNPKVKRFSSTMTTPLTAIAPAPLVEAQGWVINNKGEVVLTATAPNVTPHIPWLTPATCQTPQKTS